MVTLLKRQDPEDHSEPGFEDRRFIGKSEMLQRIRSRAWRLGQKLSPVDEARIFRDIHTKNQADVTSGKTKSVVLDFDDPALVPVNTPTEAYAEGLIKGATFGHLDIFPEQGNEDPLSMTAGGFAQLRGMIGGKTPKLGRPSNPLKLGMADMPGPIGMMKGAGVPTAVAFGAYGAASPAATGEDRLKNTVANAALGGLLEFAPGAAIMAATKVNATTGKLLTQALSTRAGEAAFNTALFAGLHKAQDPSASVWEVLPEAIGGALAATNMARRPKVKPYRPFEKPEDVKLSEWGAEREAELTGETRQRGTREPDQAELLVRAEKVRFDRAVREELAEMKRQFDGEEITPREDLSSVDPIPGTGRNTRGGVRERTADEILAAAEAVRAGRPSGEAPPDAVSPPKPGYWNRLPEPWRAPRAADPLPDVSPDPYRDAAMRTYNEAQGSQRLLTEGAVAGEGQHGYGKVMGDRQYGPVPPGGLPAPKGSPRHPRHLYKKGGAPKPPAKDVTTDMLGMQQAYESVVGRLSRMGGGRKKGARPFVPPGPGQMGGKGAPFSMPPTATGRAGRRARVPGYAETKIMEDYLEGRITSKEALAEIERHGLTEMSKELVEHLQTEADAGRLPDKGADQTVTRHRMAQRWGGGEFNNPLVQSSARRWELADQFKAKLSEELRADWEGLFGEHGIEPGYGDGRQLMDFMRLYRTGMDAEALARSSDGQKVLAGARSPGTIVRAAKDIRAQLDKQYDLHNRIKKAAGEKGLDYKPGYYPDLGKNYGWDTVKAEGWAGIKKVFMQKTEPIEPGRQDPSKKSRVPSGREKRQTLSEKDVELDPWKIAKRISNDTAGKVGDTIGLQAAKTSADALDVVGVHNSADGMRQVGEAGYNGKRYGVAGAEIRALQSTRTGQTIITAERLLKQQFNKAKYTVAVPFVILRQWGSLAYLSGYGEITPDMWAKAVAAAAKPGSGEKYLDTYTGWVKNQDRAKMFREGSMDEILSGESLEVRSPLGEFANKMRRASERPVNAMENWTGRVAVEMADMIAARANMPQADRQAFRSEVAGRTQSFYDAMNRPEMLNSPTMNLFWPAQSYSLEGLNVLRDIQNRPGLSSGQKMKAQANVVGVVFLTHLMHSYTTGFHGGTLAPIGQNVASTAGSFVPWAPSMLGVGSGPADGKIYPANLIADLGKALDYAADDDMASAFGEVSKNLIRGGAQMNRIISTDRYIGRGVLGEDERLLGSAFGWYITPSGKIYLREIKGGRSRSGATVAGGRRSGRSSRSGRSTRRRGR